jgi:hypothetical protein
MDGPSSNHAWWAWLWNSIENWVFLGAELSLAIEFGALNALKLGAPHKKAIDDA